MSGKCRVLGIVGSPRKNGNTNAMVEAVLQGAAMKGAGVELVHLSKQKIKPCKGCGACRQKGNCRYDDDMAELLGFMKESDVWVLGTPVYWWGPTGQMKTFMDRWYQDIKGLRECGKKDVILVIPYGDKDAKTAQNTIGMFQESFEYLKKNIVEIIEGPGLVDRTEAADNDKLMKHCMEIGKKIVKKQ
ncbi:MAG: flavodoxin family protein [Anaerolineae bacterium]|jgi:multimeric flavodoxin WrbA|nr:flavodoxin family protein [Anaerolineae bacterium]